jgi:hypothetical protein
MVTRTVSSEYVFEPFLGELEASSAYSCTEFVCTLNTWCPTATSVNPLPVSSIIFSDYRSVSIPDHTRMEKATRFCPCHVHQSVQSPEYWINDRCWTRGRCREPHTVSGPRKGTGSVFSADAETDQTLPRQECVELYIHSPILLCVYGVSVNDQSALFTSGSLCVTRFLQLHKHFLTNPKTNRVIENVASSDSGRTLSSSKS